MCGGSEGAQCCAQTLVKKNKKRVSEIFRFIELELGNFVINFLLFCVYFFVGVLSPLLYRELGVWTMPSLFFHML